MNHLMRRPEELRRQPLFVLSLEMPRVGHRGIDDERDVQGLDWDVGAIGNAAWTGVRLSDVLKVRRSNIVTDIAGLVMSTLCDRRCTQLSGSGISRGKYFASDTVNSLSKSTTA